MKRNKGFTLIELLVVIAIIAILAAILFPVFAQARAKARQASCTSNVKQITLGFMMYAQDYDESFPFWQWWKSWSGGDTTPNHFESIWFSAIYPYVKNSQIFACPSTNDFGRLSDSNIYGWTNNLAGSGVDPAMRNAIVSYSMNERLHDGTAFNGGSGAVSLAALNNPASTLVIGDSATALTTGWAPGDPNSPEWDYVLSRVAYPNIPAGGWNTPDICGACQLDLGKNAAISPNRDIYDQQSRHSAFTLIGYGDGHAKAVRSRSVTQRYLTGYNVK